MKVIKRIACAMLLLAIMVSTVLVYPQTTADAAFVIDYEPYCDCIYMVNLETGLVVFEKNAEKVKYPASLTKIMTCLLVLEYYSDLENEKVTISNAVMTDKTLLSEGVWSATALKTGERIRLIDLLYCAMLASDNYAALALAYKVSEDKGDGTIDWFIKQMNSKAAELGCTNTQFVNPHGLFNENHYSTAKDMFLICKYAMEMPSFAEIVETDVPYYRPPTNMTDETVRFETTNRMMMSAYVDYYYQYVKGIKTGFLKASGHTYASYAVKDGYSYIIVCMDDGATSNYGQRNDAMVDAKQLFQWAFSDLSLKEVVNTNTVIVEAPVEWAWNKTTVELVPSESFRTIMPSNIELSSILVETDIPGTLKAPLRQGDVVGTASLIYANEVIGVIDLVAGETVQRSELLYIMSIIDGVFDSTLFLIFAIMLVLGVVGYVIYSLIHARNIGSLKKVRRYASARSSVRPEMYRSYNADSSRTSQRLGSATAEAMREDDAPYIPEKTKKKQKEGSFSNTLKMIGEDIGGLFGAKKRIRK
ncbi:MAG: D-alanyl-D-alanine carboxypeptidase [Ruminococcaceae bacterium]|nr:D-alanyl-D-alanine carboxypeptidase [Oscillospiraceae bacterium]